MGFRQFALKCFVFAHIYVGFGRFRYFVDDGANRCIFGGNFVVFINLSLYDHNCIVGY